MRVALAILLVLALAPAVQAQEETTGEVRGTVLMGGLDGSGAPGLEVSLTHLTMDPMPPRSTVADENGGFSFQDLPMGPSHGYIASAEFEGVIYESAFVRALSGESVLTADVVVFPVTTSDETVSIARIHDVVTAEPGTLEVLEFLVLENTGGRTVSPQGGIRVPLPGGALGLAFPEADLSGTVILGDDELVITAPLLPGSTELVYLYRLPYTGTAYRWEKPLAYPTGALDLLVKDTGVDVSATGLLFQGVVEPTPGEPYLHWSAVEMEAGEAPSAEFRGLPSLSQAPSSAPTAQEDGTSPQSILRGLAVLMAPLGAAAAYLYAIYRGRYPRAIDDQGNAGADRRRRALLRRLVSLDEAFAAGTISERRYLRERRETKAKLVVLMGSAEGRDQERVEVSPGD